jgi:very-short-patch-repair endonuclease
MVTYAKRALDAQRTVLIEAQGFRVLRFSTFDVQRSLDSVLETIFAAVARTPTPNPSPQGGGEGEPGHA